MTVLGNGVDIIEVRRIKKAIDKHGDGFLKRIFTNKELENAKARSSAIYQHLAGRFAVKEAIFKALGDKEIGFQDVEVLNDAQGKPYCCLLNRNRDKLSINISISHIKNYAVASAIITQETSGS